jgi:hypothetical protein
MATNSAYETVILPSWLRWALYLATIALFATGAVWLIAHYGMRPVSGDDLPHPAEPWILRVHGFAVMVGLFIYGSLLRAHMLKAWTLKRNRITGACVATVLVSLTVTGYMLYYVGGETSRPIISVAHWVIGLAIGALLPLHIWRGRRSQRAAR